DAAVVEAVAADLDAENLERDADDEAIESPSPSSKQKQKKTKKRAAEAPQAAEERKRAVGEDERRPAAALKAAQSPVVIPFESARKLGAQAAAARQPEPAAKDATKFAHAAPAEQKEASKNENDMMQDQPRADSMSVLDRLRQRRAPTLEPAPEPATLKEVAEAIAEASASSLDAEEKSGAAGDDEFFDAPTAAAAPIAEVAPAALSDEEPRSDEVSQPVEDPKDWRRSALKSIDETREELKSAHASVARMGARFADIEKRRRERRARVAAGLGRAQALLGDIGAKDQ
ncbi:MAG: hypothetical protein WD076_09440, partial [Parvularculaceae bacterium]